MRGFIATTTIADRVVYICTYPFLFQAVARAHSRLEGIRAAAAGEVNLKMWKNAFHRREYLLEVIESRMCLDCPFMAPNKDALHAHIEVGHNYGTNNRTWGRPPKQ